MAPTVILTSQRATEAEAGVRAMQGPILRPIQRLGKLGKRSNVPQTETADPNQTKDPKFVYLSIDECGSHVGDRKTTFFRCLFHAMSDRYFLGHQ